jgi:hypothetical protein
MGLKFSEIRKKCLKCDHHRINTVGELALQIYWCVLADMACEDIKRCDVPAKAWVRK